MNRGLFCPQRVICKDASYKHRLLARGAGEVTVVVVMVVMMVVVMVVVGAIDVQTGRVEEKALVEHLVARENYTRSSCQHQYHIWFVSKVKEGREKKRIIRRTCIGGQDNLRQSRWPTSSSPLRMPCFKETNGNRRGERGQIKAPTTTTTTDDDGLRLLSCKFR
jgi:hypothetical protein